LKKPAPEILKADVQLPAKFALTNYPNPFNPSTTIEFALPQDGVVHVEIFDLTGRRVAVLIDEERSVGRHKAIWNARNETGSKASSGIYFVRATFDGQVLNRKIVLMR